MTRGVPKIGNFEPTPKSTVLGTVKEILTDPSPQEATYVGGTVDLTEPPPPWEVDPSCELTPSDARRYVKVPDNWVLYWINPKVLDRVGWRYWQPVTKSDSRVTVIVETMVSPEGNIRRGGTTGDILGWMYRSWFDSRKAEQARLTAELTQSAIDRQETLKDEFKRGKYGPFVKLESATHPTHTMGDGRSMKD